MVSICVFSVRAHLIWSLALLCVPHLRPSFFCVLFKCILNLYFVSMVKAIKSNQIKSRRLMREGVTRLAFKILPKLLAVSLLFLIICQEGLSSCPAIRWLTC